MIGRLWLFWIATVFAPMVAEAQVVTVCEAPNIDLLRVETVIAVELRRRVQLTRLGTCHEDLVQIQVVTEASQALRLELSLVNVEPAARDRFLALVIVEMIRSGELPTTLEGATSGSNGESTTTESAGDDPRDEELGGDGSRAPVAPVPVDGAAMASSQRQSAGVLGVPQAYSHIPSTERRLASVAAGHQGVDRTSSWGIAAAGSESAGADGSDLQLRFAAGPRIYMGDPTTPLLAVAGALQLDRFSFHLDVGGAELSGAWAWNLTAGVGYRVAWHRGPFFDVTLGVRAEVGVGLAMSDGNGFDVVGTTEAAPVFAALLEPAIVLHLGPDFDLGLLAMLGVQQGFRVMDEFAFSTLTLHGLFTGGQLVFGAKL